MAPHSSGSTRSAAAAGDNATSNSKSALVLASRSWQPLAAQPLTCSLAIHDLDQETIELIFTFLPPQDRRSAAAVCRLWRRVHNSSTKLWGSVLLSGERIVQAAASAAAAGSVGAWLAARLEAMRAVRLWSPGTPLEAFASSLAQLLSRENRVQVRVIAVLRRIYGEVAMAVRWRVAGQVFLGAPQAAADLRSLTACHLFLPPLQSFSYVCGDASVSRLLGELQRLTSLQRLDVLAPWAAAPGQGLVVWARELAK